MRLSDIELRAMNSPWRRWGQRNIELPLMRRLGLEVAGRDVLEIGCGSGYGAYLINRLKPRSYLGLDLMSEQIESARQNYPQFNFIQQDASDLSHFTPESFDVIVIFGVLHHIPRWREVIDQLQRVLRPSGSLSLEEPRGRDLRLFDFFFQWGHPDSDFGLQPLEEHLRQHGWKLAQKRWTPLMTLYHIRK